MQAAGFDLERGIHGSKAKHMDPAVYNAIKAEEAKLEAEKDGLKKQKEVLEDEVDTLLSEKDALTIEIETLNREKKQAETAVKGLQTSCSKDRQGFAICADKEERVWPLTYCRHRNIISANNGAPTSVISSVGACI